MKYTTITEDPKTWPIGDGWVLVWEASGSRVIPHAYLANAFLYELRLSARNWLGVRWACITNPFGGGSDD